MRETSKPTSVRVKIDLRCTLRNCVHKTGSYDIDGSCANCGHEFRAMLSIGHRATSGILGPECPRCGVRDIYWKREEVVAA